MSLLHKEDKLIIVGTGEFRETAYGYITHDSPYEVVAFSSGKNYINNHELFRLPIVPFENLEEKYDPSEYKIIVAISHTQLSRIRTRIYKEA